MCEQGKQEWPPLPLQCQQPPPWQRARGGGRGLYCRTAGGGGSEERDHDEARLRLDTITGLEF